MIRVSIVVTVFDTPPGDLNRALWAATHQTFRADQVEVIVVDDGSTDPTTIRELDQYCPGATSYQLLRHEAPRGLASARATGTRAAQGKFVLFIDGADMLARDTAESLFYRARSVGADVVTAPYYLWDKKSQSYQTVAMSEEPFPVDRALLAEGIFTASVDLTISGRLVARSLLTDDVFSPVPSALSDLVTAARLFLKAEAIAFHDRHYCYRIRETSPLEKQDFIELTEGLRSTRTLWHEIVEREVAAGALDPVATGWVAEGIAKLYAAIAAQTWSVDDDAVLDALCTAAATEFGTVSEASLGQIVAPNLSSRSAAPVAGRVSDVATWLLQRDDTYSTERARGLRPTRLAKKLEDKVVLVCQVDYQVRAAVRFVEELRLRGHACAVLDNSRLLAQGKRASTKHDRKGLTEDEYFVISKTAYEPDWFATAKFVALFNDFIPEFREALEYRHRLGLPTACIVEGINDFERTDFVGNHFLSYRRCDYVFTAGDDDTRFFEDRSSFMVGLPRIEDLAQRPPEFPRYPLVAVNLNFSYGVLSPEAPNIFLASARVALLLSGSNWVVTRHPMDNTWVDPFRLFAGTQYELIDACTVFVSRFATGILEALASGKPAIYFNPHGEQVDKFLNPLGAFEVAADSADLARCLARALTDVENGVDFRARAVDYLHMHAGWSPTQHRTAAQRLADALDEILNSHIGIVDRPLALLGASPARDVTPASRPPDCTENAGNAKQPQTGIVRACYGAVLRGVRQLGELRHAPDRATGPRLRRKFDRVEPLVTAGRRAIARQSPARAETPLSDPSALSDPSTAAGLEDLRSAIDRLEQQYEQLTKTQGLSQRQFEDAVGLALQQLWLANRDAVGEPRNPFHNNEDL